MSKKYPVDDYGLVLSETEAREFLIKHALKFSKDIKEDLNNLDLYDLIDTQSDLNCIHDFEGYAILIDNEGYSDEEFQDYYNENCYYIPLKRYPKLFKAVYKDFNDLILDFEELKDCFPNNFKSKERLCHILGTAIWSIRKEKQMKGRGTI